MANIKTITGKYQNKKKPLTCPRRGRLVIINVTKVLSVMGYADCVCAMDLCFCAMDLVTCAAARIFS